LLLTLVLRYSVTAAPAAQTGVYIETRNAFAESLEDFPWRRGGLLSGFAVKNRNVAGECCFLNSKQRSIKVGS
jgi:hypothetical protein